MAETSARTSTKAKASVPVTQGLDVQGELANLYAGLSAPAADITEPAALPPLPEAPGEMELSRGVQIGRAATVLAASLSGNPELAPLLMRQYHDQDARAQASAQQRFANSFAIAESRRAEVEKADLERERRKGAAVEQQLGLANAKLRALEAAMQQVQIELSHTTDQGRREDLGAELRVLQEAVESESKQQGLTDPKSLDKSLSPSEIVMQGISRGLLTSEEQASITPETFPVLRQRVLEQMAAEQKVARPKETPQLRAIYEGLTQPLSRALYTQMIEVLPDPSTLDPGDPRVVANAANAMLAEDPAAHEKLVESLASKWYGEGRFASHDEAEAFATEWSLSEGVSDMDIPPAGGFKQGPSVVEKLMSRVGRGIVKDVRAVKGAVGKLKDQQSESEAARTRAKHKPPEPRRP